MRNFSITACVGAVSVCAGSVCGQSINIRFGSASSVPSSAYAAAVPNQAGVWNSLATVPGDYVRVPLVGLLGTSVGARLYQSGSSSIFTFNNPLTSGDDQRLMDSMILSTNSPTDGCFWVEGLTPGPYEVTMYAMTPNDPSRLNRTRVDDATPGPTMVGGTWPGHHQQGISFSRFSITTSDGVIAFHDGLYGGVLQSGINGVQFKFLGPCPMPVINSQPVSAIACPNGSASFAVTASGSEPLRYQWQLQTAPDAEWRGMGNDPAPLPCGGGSFSYAAPINSPNVTIGIRPCPGDPTVPQHFQVRCLVTNNCGSATSNEATYTICPADFNCSGTLNSADFFDFLAALFTEAPSADFNRDTVINSQDVFDFLAAFFAGC